MIRISLLLMAAPLAMWPASASTPSTRAEAVTDPELTFEARIDGYLKQLGAKQFKAALGTVEGLERSAGNPDGGRMIGAILRSAVAAAQKHDDDARRLLEQAEPLLTKSPEVMTLAIPAYSVANRPDLVGLTLDRLIARAPDIVRGFTPDFISFVLRNTGEPQATLDQRKVALAQMGFGGADGDWITAGAIGILVQRGDWTGAGDLLRYVDSPRDVEDLLIQRRFAPLWPRLEAQAGPGLANSRESSVREARQLLESAPKDDRSLPRMIEALRYAGRYDEAIALLTRLPQTPGDMAKADEQVGWAVNDLALVLHDAGRKEEADSWFSRLNSGSKPDWKISMLINRVELLVGDGKYAQALPLIEEAQTVRGSPYAEQLLRRLRYCSLVRLGRPADAAKLRGDLMAHAKDARAATVDGLICAGEADAAEQMVLANLGDDDFQEDVIRGLQQVPLTADDPSVWDGWQVLRQRPAVAAAFARLGRDLPAGLRLPAKR